MPLQCLKRRRRRNRRGEGYKAFVVERLSRGVYTNTATACPSADIMSGDGDEYLLASEPEPDLDYELVEDIQGRMILHWNYRSLKELPLELLNYGEHIQEIYLKRNCLSRLPPDIGKLYNLTNLYLVGNQLEGLPPQIRDLKSLRVLDLSQNYIKRLPDTIGELVALEGLLVSFNRLEEIPKCLKKLEKLKMLELSGNLIYSLPDELFEGSLQSLEEFAIDTNPIASIPRNICLLPNLWYFSACRCNLLLLPSLPFYKLLHGSCNVLRNASADSEGVGNKNLQFLFDGNTCLNYIPYWVLRLLGTSVRCHGYNIEPADVVLGALPNYQNQHEPPIEEIGLSYPFCSDVNRTKIKINFKGQRRTLHFDEDMKHLHHHDLGLKEEADKSMRVTVPTLFELCLRSTYQEGLLDGHNQVLCNAKPVNEPLIVPKKANRRVINAQEDPKEMGGNMEGIKDEVKDPKQDVGVASCSTAVLQKTGSASADNSELRETLGPEVGDDAQRNRATSSPQATSTDAPESINIEEIDLNAILPKKLTKLLKKGPVTRCFECLCPIFTESWPIIFHIARWAYIEAPRDIMDNDNELVGEVLDNLLIDGKISIGCVYFCGASCQSKFRKSVQTTKITRFPIHDLKYIVDNEIYWVQL